MLERLPEFEAELADVERRLSDPEVFADQRLLRDLSRRHKELEPVVTTARALAAAEGDLVSAHQLHAELSGDDRELAQVEIEAAQDHIAELEEGLRLLLLPKDPNDGRNVIVEIRGAEGGEEANLFAKDLFEMYTAFAARRGWTLETMSSAVSDMGGFDEVVFRLVGADSWAAMKHEGGPHRVQRVPVTESQGRVHTSAATVTVLPEAEEVDVAIDASDLQIDVYRSSGPGGQSVNTTDSAVRITHKPTGIVVAMQDERSQIQNRAKAMAVLRSRLLKLEQDRQASELSEARKGQIGGGSRSEKIRTYNYKENRVSDHRIGFTRHNLDRVLAGDLDELVDALLADERTRQLAGGGPA